MFHVEHVCHRNLPIIGFSFLAVSFGQELLAVIIAFSSAFWLGQEGAFGILKIALRMISFAEAAFFWRLAITVFTETGSSSTFQQSKSVTRASVA